MVPVLALVVFSAAVGLQPAQSASSIRIVRIAVGPAGAESGGRYVLSEERTTFSRQTDRQVVVTFEWDGSKGRHRIKATWRNLDSAVTSTSEIEYSATAPRFGSYWTLPLSESTPIGQWRLDVTVDDEPAGVAMFQIAAGGAPSPARRTVLSSAELYERATASSVILERLDSNGVPLGQAVGVVLGNDRFVTALAAIDDTAIVRVRRPEQTNAQITTLEAWHPRLGWALVSSPSSLGAKGVTPASHQPGIGDRCYSLVVGNDGSRVLTEGSISGQQNAADGALLFATFVTGTPTAGAPVLNEAGETIGIVRDSAFDVRGGGQWRWRLRTDTAATTVVPLAIVSSAAGRSGGAISDLLARGLLVTPLAFDQNVVSGGFAPRLIKVNGATQPFDQRYEFSARDAAIVVFIVWSPQQRTRGMATLKLYDEDRRQIAESRPTKLDVKVGSRALTDWKLAVPETPGIYRVEVLIDGRAAWRDYFRVVQ